jgi:hypothetical protein
MFYAKGPFPSKFRPPLEEEKIHKTVHDLRVSGRVFRGIGAFCKQVSGSKYEEDYRVNVDSKKFDNHQRMYIEVLIKLYRPSKKQSSDVKIPLISIENE